MNRYLEAGGKKRPFLFRYKALKALCRALNIKLSELSKLDDIDFLEAEKIIYLGLKHGYEASGKSLDFEEEDIEGWIDEDFPLVEKGMSIFNEQVAEFIAGKKKKEVIKKAPPKK